MSYNENVLKDLVRIIPQKGKVEWIGIRSKKKKDLSVVESIKELLSKVVFELKIKRQSGFQESPRFHQRIVHLQSPLPGNQSHVTFSNSFLHIVPA